MNFINRAFKNVTRRLTKSILLAVTFFLIGNLVILGLGISQAAENAKTLTRQRMKAVVSYEVDYEKYWNYISGLTDQTDIDNANKNWPKLDKDIALNMAKDEHVKTVNYLTNIVMYSKSFKNVPLGNEELKKDQGGGKIVFTDANGNEVVQDYQEPNLMVFTNIVPNMIEFEDGTNTIVEGKFYTQEQIDNKANVVVISKELADTNNFKVGDTLTITAYSKDMFTTGYYQNSGINYDSVGHDYEIVGIYTTIRDVDPNASNFKYMSPYESPKNYIYIPLTTVAQLQFEDSSKLQEFEKTNFPQNFDSTRPPLTVEDFMAPGKVVYLIDDPLNVDKFVEANKVNLPEYTHLNANNDTFKTLAKPLDTLSFFANVIVWIVAINAIVIITLVTALTLKTREYEIGVLLSLGVSKIKIVLQLFSELLIVALLGFTLAVASGSMIAGTVGDKVLAFQQSQQDENKEQMWDSGGWVDPTNYFSTVSQEELFAQYKVSVSPLLIAEIYLFGLTVVFVAIVVPSVMIMRLNPKQILLSTN